MHAGNPDRSARLRRLLDVLTAHPDGLTTAELISWTGSCAPHSDAAELRQSGYRVDCRYEGRTATGRRVHRYVLVGRET